MNEKSPIMLELENAFLDLKQDNKNKQALLAIEKCLKRKFDLEVKVDVVKNKHNELFGMSVYPQHSLIEAVITEILSSGNPASKASVVEKMWAENKEWYIDIDSIILNDMNLNTNPSELVAVLLHEVGHVVYSNTVPNRITKVLKYQLIKSNHKLKQIVKWKRCQRILDIIVVEACSGKNFKNVNKEELQADYFAYSNGYGEALNSFINKLLISNGNSMIDRTDEEMEKDVEIITKWTLTNIGELEFRKNSLQKMLETEMRRNPSTYVRSILLNVKNLFFSKSNQDNYTGILKESTVIKEWRHYEEKPLLESYKDAFDNSGIVKRIKAVDLNILEIQVGKIKNLDDKLYVLDNINNYQEILDVQDELRHVQTSNNRPLMTKESIDKFRLELDDLRKRAMKVKTSNYHSFFKSYPTGYEG